MANASAKVLAAAASEEVEAATEGKLASVVAPAMAELDELSPEAFDASRGFDDAELETCLKVLRALGGGGDADGG